MLEVEFKFENGKWKGVAKEKSTKNTRRVRVVKSRTVLQIRAKFKKYSCQVGKFIKGRPHDLMVW